MGNDLSWSRAVTIALGGRIQLDCLTLSSPMPEDGDQKLKEWRTNDYMVMSLLINSMLPEVAETHFGARTFT